MARRSFPRLAVLAVLLEDPSTHRHGFEIAKMAGYASGTVYPILARLEADGWLTSEWEDIDEVAEGRPRRRNYKLVGDRVGAARMEVMEAQRALRPAIGLNSAGAPS